MQLLDIIDDTRSDEWITILYALQEYMLSEHLERMTAPAFITLLLDDAHANYDADKA